MPARATKRRQFLAATGAGALALVGGAKVEAAEWTDAERANVKTVTDFCAAWSTRDMAKVLAFLADDCVYRMTETTAPANGHDGVISRLKSYVEGSDRVQFRVLDTFATGPIVINHRIDQFVSSRPLTWEGVGVFFVKDGKIKEWSDYTIRTQR
jgi:limonene-1,2-epoxide hydrolase